MIIGIIVLLIALLLALLMAITAYYLWGMAVAEERTPQRGTPSDGELALPAPERPIEAPPQPLGFGLGSGAYFDSDVWEDEEAATEVAVLPPSAPAPPPSRLTPMMSFGALEDADDQATEVMDASANAELAAALRAAQAEEIPSFGERGGAYFDDDWDEEEAPTAVMTGDVAAKYAEMLLDADEDEDGDDPVGPGRVVAKKDR